MRTVEITGILSSQRTCVQDSDEEVFIIEKGISERVVGDTSSVLGCEEIGMCGDKEMKTHLEIKQRKRMMR